MERETLLCGLVERLRDCNTALVANACDFLGHPVDFCDSSIQCLSPELPALVGEAYTIRLSCGATAEEKGDMSGYWELLDLMSRSNTPKVMVVECVTDPVRACVAGDGMAKTLLTVGAGGIVTNGCLRDTRDIIRQGFSIYGVGRIQSHYALSWSGIGEPVRIGGITISQGSLIHADGDGVSVIPEEAFPKLLRACRYVLDFEKKAHLIYRQAGIPMSVRKQEVQAAVREYSELIRSSGDWEV